MVLARRICSCKEGKRVGHKVWARDGKGAGKRWAGVGGGRLEGNLGGGKKGQQGKLGVAS